MLLYERESDEFFVTVEVGEKVSGARHGVRSQNMQVLDARRDFGGGYQVDVNRGERVGRVSRRVFAPRRPAVRRSTIWPARSASGLSVGTRVVETALIHVEANRSDPERLSLILPGSTPRADTGVLVNSPRSVPLDLLR